MSSVLTHKVTGDNSNRANAAFMLGLFTILGALCFQYIGGLQPCELCYGQRTPYYLGLPILAGTIIFWQAIPVLPRIAITLILALIFVWSTYMGAFHAGVEWKLWAGPTSCTGSGDLNFSDLNAVNDTKVVPCDVASWRFLGLSFAGYNAVISLVICALLAWSALGQFTRYQNSIT